MKFCLTLAEPGLRNLERKLHEYKGQTELIEIRLDHLDRATIPSLPSSACEWIATCRPVREGGHFSGTESERLAILETASRSGFDWVDLEWDSPLPKLDPRVRVIRSRHFFDHTPTDLESCWQSIEIPDRGVGKLVPTVTSNADLIRLMDWTLEHPERQSVCFGMGPIGQVSRYLGALATNAWTYVAESSAQAVAPGQFGLLEAQALRRLDPHPSPELYGVLGNPVAHSLSPALHNHLFSRHGLNSAYFPICLDGIQTWLEFVERSPFRFRGFSVTIPFKNEAARAVQGHPPTNTLRRTSSGWESFNTDEAGFIEPLSKRLELRGAEAVVVGYGGAAETAVRTLVAAQTSVTIVGRDCDRARVLAERHRCSWTSMEDMPRTADLLVNATPVGLWPRIEDTPVDPRNGKYAVVFDLVYNPPRTRLLKLAEQTGAITISGLEMFAEQAALQFLIWTGIAADREEIRSFLGSLL